MCLKDVATFIKERINSDKLNTSNYISTENMKSDFGGIDTAASVPSNANVIGFRQKDVLLSNIRPYLKKVWYADREGGCSADVFVLRATNQISPDYLHYVLANDRFISYAMAGAKGVKMPRGDKEQMFKYSFAIPEKEEQAKIACLISLLDKRIATQIGLIEDLKKLKSAITDKLYANVKGNTYSYRQLFSIINERNKELAFTDILSASQELGMVEREDLNLDIKFERNNITTYKIVRKGDYVIHLRSFQGGFAFSEINGVCSPAYTILRPNDMLEHGYLSFYFTSKAFVNSLRLVTYGIRDGRSINVDEWLDMKVSLPTINEQKRILSIIGSIGNKIANESAILSNMNLQRQYLLRMMFA